MKISVMNSLATLLLLMSATSTTAFQPHPTTNNRCHYHQSTSTKLHAGSDDNNASPKVRFSGMELDKQSSSASGSSISSSSTAATTTNPLDGALSFISSDIASIALGMVGLVLLLIERLSLPDADTMGISQVQYAEQLGEETRSNLIAVVACGSVLLNGISKLDVTSALAETVELEGDVITEPLVFDESLEKHKTTLQWGMESFLKATPAKTVVILRSNSKDDAWQVFSMVGTVPTEATLTRPELLSSTPILDRFRKDGSGKETYLPTLQFLPGKAEFTYIPENTQGVLILSVPASSPESTQTTAILLGSNRAKSFTPRDVAWCQTLAARFGTVFNEQ